jgi:hypothetical protein
VTYTNDEARADMLRLTTDGVAVCSAATSPTFGADITASEVRQPPAIVAEARGKRFGSREPHGRRGGKRPRKRSATGSPLSQPGSRRGQAPTTPVTRARGLIHLISA